jgi:hypothetical protein
MLTSILIILLVLAILFIAVLLKKLSLMKSEKHVVRENAKTLCHDFKTSLTTLHLVVNSLKDYIISKHEHDIHGGLTSLLDILNDVGQSLARSISQLSQQAKYKSEREGDSL